MSNIERLDIVAHKPIPTKLAVAYPSDYGLANAISSLIRDYGRQGAVNRLIEAAERVSKEEDHMAWPLSRRRVELSVQPHT